MPGVKRKRSHGAARAAKRRRRNTKFPKRKSRRSLTKRTKSYRAVEKPPLFRHVALRTRTWHKNIVTFQIATPATGFTNALSVYFLPARLRDPDVAQRRQPFPENFTTLAGLYQRYRVNGFTVKGHMFGKTNTEDEKTWICAYTTSNNDGATDPFNASVISDRATRDAFMQFPGIRKKQIVDSGTTGDRRNTRFNFGYYSIPGMEQKRRNDVQDAVIAGSVNPNGSVVQDPALLPKLYFRVVSPRFAGYNQARTYDVTLEFNFYVEWFDRREALEPDQGETDPV